MLPKKVKRRIKIRKRIRRTVQGTSERPRLAVFRSNKQIYAQLIDDVAGHTLFAASSREIENKGVNKVDQASATGKMLADRATASGISKVIFDRAGYLYHGRVKSLAEGARTGGLKF